MKMTDILEYYVMRKDGGVTLWLETHEVISKGGRLETAKSTWSPDFDNGSAFASAKQAHNAAKRQLNDDQVFYVMGCMATPTDDED
jgi:hypothetical protein